MGVSRGTNTSDSLIRTSTLPRRILDRLPQEQVVGEGWTQEYANGAKALEPTVQNVHLKNVTCSNGTIDYFRWDPEGSTGLQSPTLNFTIADADPHKYAWIIYYRKTSGCETWTGEYWAAYGLVTGNGQVDEDGLWTQSVSVNLADTNVSGHLDPEVHPWCTYTYDILVMEYTSPEAPEGIGDKRTMDYNYLKYPYCLWVPETTPETPPREGHTVWMHVPEAENASPELRVTYWLNDQCQRGAEDLELVVVDPDLQVRRAVGGPWPQTLSALHGGEDADQDGEPDGVKVYEFADDDPGGTWRVLWTAQAPCGTKTKDRRTHDAQRMLVANGARLSTQFWVEEDYMVSPRGPLSPKGQDKRFRSAFARAQRTVVVPTPGSGQSPFRGVLPTSDARTKYSRDNFSHYATRNRGYVHLIGANAETSYGDNGWGKSNDYYKYSYVYVGSQKVCGWSDEYTLIVAVHEVGHQFGLDDELGDKMQKTDSGKFCVMGQGTPSALTDYNFCASCLAKIRAFRFKDGVR
ncbi:hypothetical protein LLH03_12530 [bacterium]|nr:hypothetical protein [bacterium]